MQLSSVRLGNGNFTGSGVLIDNAGTRGILTAKHNLAVRANIATPLEWEPDQVALLVEQFLTDLRVGYGPLNPPFGQNLPLPSRFQDLSPQASAIEFRNGDGTWDYDLMFISVGQGLPLREFIDESADHRIFYRPQDVPFYNGGMADRAVFVTGFGNILDATGAQTSLSHPFQVRNATVTAREDDVQRNVDPPANFENVVLVTAANNTSTAPGDSGGPMFTVNNNRVYLLGATLGSNFRPDETIADDPIVNNASTYLLRHGQLF